MFNGGLAKSSAIVALGIGVLARPAAAPAAGSVLVIGNINCQMTLGDVGAVSVNPPMSLTGSAGGMKVSFKGTLSNCTVSPLSALPSVLTLPPVPSAITVVSGTVAGSGFFLGYGGAPANNCGNFTNTFPTLSPLTAVDYVGGKFKIKIAWKASTAIAGTKITYNPGVAISSPRFVASNYSADFATSPGFLTITLGGSSALTGTTAQTGGSFTPGNINNATLVLSTSYPSSCPTTSFPSFSFGPPSSFVTSG